ncbi:MAG TPA: ABATE domain-containing protein [Terriglobales bacterium]|nr:ABATE domain-containing protein [Terriglobales bacterium]
MNQAVMPRQNSKSPFEFTGGHLCLNFTNTVDNRKGLNRKELLTSYADLLRWAEEANILRMKDAGRLQNMAEAAPGQAKSALRSALQLRESLYALFSAATERRAIPGTALSVLNRAVQRTAQHERIAQDRRRFQWELSSPESNLDSILWPIARSAADLLTSPDLQNVRQCASTDCAWLFLDITKNHRRRWCEMKTCGNRAKARRYYERQKSEL